MIKTDYKIIAISTLILVSKLMTQYVPCTHAK